MIENSTGTIVITAGQVRIGTVVRATAWTASMDGWLRVHGRDRVFKRNQSTCAMMLLMHLSPVRLTICITHVRQ